MSLKLEYAVDINATPDAIWRVFEQIEDWPRWDAESLRSVRWISGDPWTQGARFELQIAKPMSFTLTPQILEVEAPVYVHLKGSGSGVTGEQHYIFKWNPDKNVTEASTLQEFSGMAITFMGNRVRQPILDGIAHMFGKIKQEAEAAQPPTVTELPPSSLYEPAPSAAEPGFAVAETASEYSENTEQPTAPNNAESADSEAPPYIPNPS